MSEQTSQFSGKHKLDGTWVKDLHLQIGRSIYERFIVYKIPEAIKMKKGDYFISIEVGDKTGRVNLKIWGVPEFEVRKTLEWFEVEKVYVFNVQVKQYREKIELHMNWSANSTPWLCEFCEDVKITDYFEQDFCDIKSGWTEIDVDIMIEFVEKIIQKITHQGFRKILQVIWQNKELKNEFVKYPAGKWHHHAYYNGLLQHVYEMLRLAETLIELYPDLNSDLLYTGIILHDFCKLQEYSLGIQISANEQAFKLGHMVLAVRFIDRLIAEKQIEIEEQDLTELYNLILSHHGTIADALGSAVDPKSPEAEVMHHLDMLSARTNKMFLEIRRQL